MNTIIESLTGMNKLSDQIIVSDLLISVKSGIRNYAIAITEVASPEVRAVLRNQLNDAIDAHDKITKYMMAKGYYHPYDLKDQIQMDIKTSDTALNLMG